MQKSRVEYNEIGKQESEPQPG